MRLRQAAKAYERHCAENGQPASHAEAKELLAGFAGAFIDREVETKGLDFVDREKAKYEGTSTLLCAATGVGADGSTLARRQLHDTYDQNDGQF